ncbi:MAG: nitroreductase, partial [Chitinophagales bacterium]
QLNIKNMKAGILTPITKKTETIKTIYERRAVRKFNDKKVERALVEQLLDAGRMAPTAMNRQSWKFYVLTNKETIHEFSKEIAKVAAKDFLKAGPRQILKTAAKLLHGFDFFKTNDPVFHKAPVVIFITAPRNNEWGALDIGMCAQNMMLAAKSLGLDSCPVGFGKYVEKTESFSRLRVPASEQVHISIIFGYGDESPELHERIRDNAIFIDGSK